MKGVCEEVALSDSVGTPLAQLDNLPEILIEWRAAVRLRACVKPRETGVRLRWV